jgi:hypothetical protein
MALRILLQDRESHLYFKCDEEWTPEIKQARDFGQVLNAATFVRENKLANADVLICFDDPGYDVRITPCPT